jgi:hypothetical protein
MRSRFIFGTVFLVTLLTEARSLASADATTLSRVLAVALLVVCVGGGWMGVRNGTPWRGIVAVEAGAVCAHVLLMAVYILSGAAVESGSGPAVVGSLTIVVLVYPLLLAATGAGAALLARLLTRRASERPAR